MSIVRHPILALGLMLVVLTASLPAGAGTVRIGGTGMGLGLMATLGEAFAARTKGCDVEVLPSLGSSGGIRALLAGAIGLGISARPAKDRERAAGVRSIAFARTPFVLASSHAGAQGIDVDELAAIYGAAAPVWQDGTPIRIILRQENDTDSRLLISYFPGMAEALASARTRPGVPVAVNDQENLLLAQALPGSLTAASLMQVVAEGAGVSLLSIAGSEPSLRNLADGSYPYFKTLYLVLPPGPDPDVEAFVRFARSDEAAGIISASGALRGE